MVTPLSYSARTIICIKSVFADGNSFIDKLVGDFLASSSIKVVSSAN